MPNQPSALTVIIPTLNEEDSLPHLIGDLLKQQNCDLKIVVVDGGSTDGTLSFCKETSTGHPDIFSSLQSEPGRAKQMNLAAGHARTEWLLFLHADTRINNSQLLHQAMLSINQEQTENETPRVAGHFGMRFKRSLQGYDKAFFFYEAKTHLNRKDCINGDQGFLIHAEFFKQLGKFDTSLPYMEDARLAEKIFSQGQWITLPGEVQTSARRFETEGFRQRQILNSFLCNFQSIGLFDFFDRTQEAYRSQDTTTTLHLPPLLRIIHTLMLENGIGQALKRWYQTGGYITDNAWQLAFSADCRQAQKKGKTPGECKPTRLKFYDRWIAWFITSPPCRAATGLLTIIWFYSLFITERKAANHPAKGRP